MTAIALAQLVQIQIQHPADPSCYVAMVQKTAEDAQASATQVDEPDTQPQDFEDLQLLLEPDAELPDEVPDVVNVPEDSETKNHLQELPKVALVLESMSQTLPINRYTMPLSIDIEETKFECALTMSAGVVPPGDAPEDTGLDALSTRINVLMDKFMSIKSMYDGIMEPKQSVRRSASDPPEPRSCKKPKDDDTHEDTNEVVEGQFQCSQAP